MQDRLALSLMSCLLIFALLSTEGAAQERSPAVPADLQPLLSKPQSRMHVVARRYSRDRELLSRFYAVPLSTAHLARVKRFDMSWQTAAQMIDANHFDAGERAELAGLGKAIESNLAALDVEAAAAARARPLVPFAKALEGILEDRRKVTPMDAKKSAGIVARITAQIRGLVVELDAGRLAIPNREVGARAADAVRELRRLSRDWFRFYNNYDPLFTWWLAKPYEGFGAAMDDYTNLLRKKSEGAVTAEASTGKLAHLEPAPPTKFPDVPDLAALLALRQNEMAGVLAAFRGDGRGGSGRSPRGGRQRGGGAQRSGGQRGGAQRSGGQRGGAQRSGGQRGGAQRGGAQRGGRGQRGGRRARGGPPRTEKFYTDWRAALATLDFDRLSRPAQVAYLGLRKDIDVALLRMRTPAQKSIPSVPDESGIRGRPIGKTALMLSLADEMIAYTPEELIAIGDAEYAWCMDEMLKASRELGFGDKWRAAMEHVKTLHPPPGGQPVVIRELMFEAVDFLREHDMLTVPQIAAETLSMGMMSPARQLVNPFFTGGSRISVSFPTDTMSHDAKLQSMRGNNTPFSRATVHHELIPGHNLQGFVGSRFASVQVGTRRTPFHSEGWAVYFEMLLYRMGFPAIAAVRAGGPKAAENRIGFLFWRMHRSARITFSLRFHMGLWSAQQCIDFLVDGVGHERENAIAEVRRSFAGSYGPLYQAGYLLGAVQFRQLNEEIVQTGKMQERDFHDAILRAGPMPVALVRLRVSDQKLTPDMSLDWEFYGATSPQKRK